MAWDKNKTKKLINGILYDLGHVQDYIDQSRGLNENEIQTLLIIKRLVKELNNNYFNL